MHICSTGSFATQRYIITNEIEYELGKDSPLGTRLKAMTDLCDKVTANKIDEVSIVLNVFQPTVLLVHFQYPLMNRFYLPFNVYPLKLFLNFFILGVNR